MPRSSRHKSDKESKHGLKESKYCADSEEDVKMKERNNSKEEDLARVSKDSGRSASGEKRKLGREGKDLSGHGNVNGDASEEYAASKRRKEKAADGSGGGDRWKGGGDEKGEGGAKEKELKGESSRIDLEKGFKSKESKVSGDSKSKSSRRHESGGDKEENVGSTMEKEESKSRTRSDSKRKSEKDSGRKEGDQNKDMKEGKEKERGSGKERKAQDCKRDVEVFTGNEKVAKKQGSHSAELGEERQSKRSRENTVLPLQDEVRNPGIEKELEKRIQKRRDGSSDKHQDDLKGSDDKRLSSRADHAKDGRYKDGTYVDKYLKDDDKDHIQRDDKYQEDGVRESRHRDVKQWEDRRDSRHKEDKYREGDDREYRHRDDKYHEDSERDNRRRDDKHREDSNREDSGKKENRLLDDKYREDGDIDNKHRDKKYRDDNERDKRRRGDRYRDDGEKDDRHRDGKYREDGDRENRHKKEKRQEDVDRDSIHRDGKQGDDADIEKRLRDVKFRDERLSRDHTSDKSDFHSRDETNTADVYRRKSSVRDGSPSYDDRVTGHKDDQRRRRANDKEDHGDMRSRSAIELRSDAEKRSMSSAKVDLVTDRGRSSTRNNDVEVGLNYSRRRSSPSSSSHAGYRLSKQEESKYRDYAYEERARHSVPSGREYATAAGITDKISSSWSVGKPIQKEDSHFGELSGERRLKSDAHASPLQMVDKSPSSRSADRRHLDRSDVRRNLDVEELGQRSGGSKDTRDYSGKEGRESRELPMEIFPGDEDGDNLSVSSPFSRTGQFYGNSKSLLHPPPSYRTGVDSPLGFGSSEVDNRGKSINRHRRIGDPNLGRVHGNAWKNVPNWPSPVANGFMPFQHGPPPVSFHPVMQQFPAPPMFGIRPSMELSHTGVPYHIPDADRFSGHGRPLGWRNPVDDSCPPPLHGWDANNGVFGGESHIYGRSDWDHSRTQMSSRGWETSGDMWKGQNSGASMELPSAYQNKDLSAVGPADEVWANRSGQQAQNEQNQLNLLAESIDIDQSTDALERNTPEAPKTLSEESPDISKMSRKDDSHLFLVYLSKLDISTELTQPELYNQCSSLMNMDLNTVSDEDNSNTFYMQKVIEAKVRIPTKTSSTSLFSSINDSVFQKSMSLYKRQRKETRAVNGEKISFANGTPTSVQGGAAGSNDGKEEELALACDQQEAEGALPNSSKGEAEQTISLQKLEVVYATAYPKLDEPILADTLEKSEEPISNLNMVKMEVDPRGERSDAHSHNKIGDVIKSIDSGSNHAAINCEDQIFLDTKCGPLLFSDVSSGACEAVMPESIESGLVNLSRIHHSPESTH
ncbi:unnamed protein product [Ilex paraguariensis]|uniref:Uncharacterized protein n=1 Tax=Ilex paraguariensis TaxID=185542 RepID=A0ABC8RDW6_9AQUA